MRDTWLYICIGTIAFNLFPIQPNLAVAQAVEQDQLGFSDVPETHWAVPFIQELAARDIVGGFPDGSFHPNEPVSRAQFAAVLHQAFSQPAVREAIAFQDVPNNHWAAPAISQAYTSGFISGYPDNLFEPDQTISRAQVLVSLANGLGYSPQTLVEFSLQYYQDAAQIPDYAWSSIAAATENQLVVNYPDLTRLNPNRPVTRAEVAAFIYQALFSQDQSPVIPSPYIVCTDGMIASYQTALSNEDPEAIESFIACGPQALPTLIPGIQDSSDTVQVGSIFALGQIGAAQLGLADELVPLLITVLNDQEESEEVRSIAAQTLGDIESNLIVNNDASSTTNIFLDDAITALEDVLKEVILSTPDAYIPDTNTRGPRDCIGECVDIALNSPLFMSAANSLAKIKGPEYVGRVLGATTLQPSGSPLGGIVEDQLRNDPPVLCRLIRQLWFCR